MNQKNELNEINRDILNKELDYVEAKNKYLTEKHQLTLAKANISLTDKDTWKQLGITNQSGRDAYIDKQTEQLQKNVDQAKITLDYIAVELEYHKNRLAIQLATMDE